MTSSQPFTTTLLGLLGPAAPDQTAIILPEQNLRITYGGCATR